MNKNLTDFTTGFDDPVFAIWYKGEIIISGFKSDSGAKRYLIENIDKPFFQGVLTLTERKAKIKLDKTTHDALKYQFVSTLEGLVDGMLDHYREWKRAMDSYGFKTCGGSDKALARFRRLPLRHKADFDNAVSFAIIECPNYLTKEKA